MLKSLFNAAGVSFEGRPEILKNLAAEEPWRDLTLKLTKYENEDAIVIEDYQTKQQLGWVPKKLVPQYKNVTRLAGRIRVGSRNAGLQCFPHEAPTQRQYWAVKRWCEAHGKPMPPYTKAAYEAMFATLRA